MTGSSSVEVVFPGWVLPVAAFQSSTLQSTMEELAELQGISGYEHEVSAYIAKRLKDNRPAGSNLEVTVDNLQNVIARVGHDCAQAGLTSPSATARSFSFARSSLRRIRWTQKVHFSMIPFQRMATSGLIVCSSGASQLGSDQLKKRTVYGQAWAHALVPMQRGWI